MENVFEWVKLLVEGWQEDVAMKITTTIDGSKTKKTKKWNTQTLNIKQKIGMKKFL